MFLYKQLEAYGQSDYYGFHMPGHKRNDRIMENTLPYKLDITEIEEFDDLHHAKGLLKAAQERAAKVYHAEETCYLVNGSTVGILSAVLGCTKRGGRILMARNCHKSVYAAVYMNALTPVYIYPEYDAENGLNGVIDAGKIRELLQADCQKETQEQGNEVRGGKKLPVQKSRIQAVVITSPTYDGVVSDVRSIAAAVHEFGIPLIVDEAHGAHFGFHPYFPENANQQGADVVIHSLHKTLPSLTQTALLHMNGNVANRERIRNYVHMLQSSSPSYVLMASMDECIHFLEEQEAVNTKSAFDSYTERLEKLREGLGRLKYLRLVETKRYDRSKIVVSTRGTAYSGKQLYEELVTKYHLQMEMASGEYVLAMTSVCDTDEGFERLKCALSEIDEGLKAGGLKQTALKEAGQAYTSVNGEAAEKKDPEGIVSAALPHLEMYCTSAQAEELSEQEGAAVFRMLKESVGMTALEYAYVYPPGIPVIVPGERISEEAVRLLEQYERNRFDIEGLSRKGQIAVLF